MQICRVEHTKSKLGPYNHKWSFGQNIEEVGQNHGLPCLFDHYRCLPPFLDKALAYRYLKDESKGKWQFGFADLDQLLYWFNEGWCRVLHEEGFHIVILDMKYDLVTTLRGRDQVMYQPEHASFVGVMNLI